MPRVSITIPGKNSQPYRFKLDRKKVTIGRNPNNDIVIECPSVSSLHCTMERIEGGYILRDRKSTNGITLDDEDMAIIDLRNDIDVRVGDVKFGYKLSNEELDEIDEEDFRPQEKTFAEAREKPAKSAKIPKKKPSANIVTKGPPTGQPPFTPKQPALNSASSEGGGFLFGAAVLFLGGLSFFGGMSSKYASEQRKQGRTGEYSLLQDIRDGRPPMEIDKKEEEKLPAE